MNAGRVSILKSGSLAVSLPVDSLKQKVKQGPVSSDLVLQKMMSWCAYQERSQEESRRKLFEYKLPPEELEVVIARLIEENYLNEERFAMAFVGGKFRIKHWGRVKIRLELKKHRVSEYSMTKAMNAIGPEEYEGVLRRLIEKKLEGLKTSDRKKQFYTILNYALSRGFEGDLITTQLTQLLENKSI